VGGMEGAWCAGVYGIRKLKTIRIRLWRSSWSDVHTVVGLSVVSQGYSSKWVQPRIDH
jgi:hypothetical protein